MRWVVGSILHGGPIELFFVSTSMERDVVPWCDGSSDRPFTVDPLSCSLFQPVGSEMYLRGKSVRSWSDGSSDRSFMVDPFRYFQPVLHDWCNKGRGMCYRVFGIVHIKEPLLLIVKSSQCSCGSGFPLSLSDAI